ncbi:uncharacterized protein EAF01_008913 [Botrytis porri]|uniref:uncharacterized protein n=1 Tax=Botrytis porri TaxID=87229 RepID=UPI0019029A7E|nr:uncharacterized protein EAF01_008913 [Botrytis porri]KAF7897947.1 hypothetical protein EAF01_008913 [Botrytis porri]
MVLTKIQGIPCILNPEPRAVRGESQPTDDQRKLEPRGQFCNARPWWESGPEFFLGLSVTGPGK